MKKLIVTSIILSAILLAGCENEMLEIVDAKESAFVASIEKFENDTQTKTSLSAQNSILWSEGDELAIFQGATIADKYKVKQGTAGSSNGTFSFVQRGSANVNDDFVSGTEIPANVAVYPYESDLAISADGERFVISNVTFPALQSYTPNSFPQGAFCMVAVTEFISDHVLRFRNVAGALKLQLLGTKKVKSIELKGSNNEVLGGEASVVAYGDGTLPEIVMEDGGSKSIVLDCGEEGVQLNDTEAVSFIMAVPPTNFEEGFTVIVTYTDNSTIDINAASSNEILRSHMLKMPERNLEEVGTQGLEYIIFDDEVMESLCLNSFDSNQDGKLQFDEAAAVTDISDMSLLMRSVKSFNEFKYFTSVTAIPDNYFQDQTQLTHITFPESLKVIGNEAFSGCTSLKDFSFPDGFQEMGKGAFLNCSSITNIAIPASYKRYYIAQSAFEGCTALRRVTSGRVFSSVSKNAFKGCVSLVECDMLKSAKTFDAGAFYGCAKIQELKFADGIYRIRRSAFEGCSSIKKIVFGTADVDKLGIGSYAFAHCTSLTDVDFQEVEIDTRNLETHIFNGCTSLKKIELPSSWGLTSIPEGMFAECSSLSEVSIPQIVTEIESSAFSGCISLKQLDIPVGVTELGGGVFSGCTSLEQISIPNVKQIYASTFENCISLKKIDAASVEMVGAKAFYGCVWLKDVSFMSNVTSIGESAFENCVAIRKITLNEEVIQIPYYAFAGCTSLSIDLHENVIELFNYSLYGCAEVNAVYNAQLFQTDYYVRQLDACASLNVTILGGITEIGASMFKNRSKLRKVIIPETVNSIKNNAFESCSALSAIEIPATVTSIGNNAFKYCSSLTSCTIKSPSLAEYVTDVFYGCNNLVNIFVPSTSVDTYKTGWPDYVDKIKAIQ